MLSLLSFLILIGVLITAHELGHFVVAKLANVKVHTFSIGFGKALLSKQIGETEYRIAWLPLGGYVKLDGMEQEFGEPQARASQEQASQADEGAPIPAHPPAHPPAQTERSASREGRALGDKPAWVRALIFVAGPAMNFALPFLLLPIVFMGSSHYDEVLKPVMGSLDEGLPAYRAGLRDGDLITAIDDEPISAFWQVVSKVEAYHEGAAPLRFRVERPGVEAPLEVNVTPELIEETTRLLGFKRSYYRVGFQLAKMSPLVSVTPERPFAQAGGRDFDLLLKVGEQPISALYELGPALKAHDPTQPVSVEVERLEPLNERWPFMKRSERLTLTLPPPSTWLAGEALESLGVGSARSCLASIDPSSPAAEVLREGDCLLSVNGEANTLPSFLDARLRHEPAKPKQLKIKRGGEELEVTLTLKPITQSDPLAGELNDWSLGFTFVGFTHPSASTSPEFIPHQEGRWGFAWEKTKEHVSEELSRSLMSLGGMFSGAVSPKHLSGPVTIFYLAGREASAGWERFLFLMVTISLSIALLNLVPIPGLDGGHILIALIEMISRRRLPVRARVALQSVGVLLILSLVFFALGNDLLRMWRLSQGS